MKLAIVGSRTFTNYAEMLRYLDKIHTQTPISCIISGGAIGADKLAEQYAHKRGILTHIFTPNWKTYGKSAGIIRNRDIIGECDRCVAFWDGKSTGTKHSIDFAKKTNKSCDIVYF